MDNADERVRDLPPRQHFSTRSGNDRRSSREEHRVSRGDDARGNRPPRRDRGRRPNEEENVADNHDVSSVDQGQ